jgi:hypothetical protein
MIQRVVSHVESQSEHELPNSNSNINADLAVLHQFENK